MNALAQYLAGRISPEVAVARMLFAGASPDGIIGDLGGCASPRARALREMVASRREHLAELRAMLAGIDHAAAPATEREAVDAIRRQFDRAVALAPEASVAAYSLGDPAILAAATDELVAWLAAEGLIYPSAGVLDLGCGIGRVATALASRVRCVLGLDVSPAMIAEARRRCVSPNLRFLVGSGRGLDGLPDAVFDLVLAVDSFPYLVQAGEDLTRRYVGDAARVLRGGGSLAIFNLSYRNDSELDSADAATWASEHGLVIHADGVSPFTIWDARGFVLGKP